jgi:hypothetical protein
MLLLTLIECLVNLLEGGFAWSKTVLTGIRSFVSKQSLNSASQASAGKEGCSKAVAGATPPSPPTTLAIVIAEPDAAAIDIRILQDLLRWYAHATIRKENTQVLQMRVIGNVKCPFMQVLLQATSAARLPA